MKVPFETFNVSKGTFMTRILFVERVNTKSIAVHQHLGMTEIAHFVFQDRDYAVLSFPTGFFSSPR